MIVTKRLMLAVCVVIAIGSEGAKADSWQPSPGHRQVPIWPGAIPDARPVEGSEESKTVTDRPVAGRPWVNVEPVSQPTMTVYSPAGKNTLYPGHMLEHTTKKFQLNPYVPVTNRTPPTLLVQDEDDPVDDVENSLVYYAALKKAGAPVEIHLYAQGGHGRASRQLSLPRAPRGLPGWVL